MSSAQTTAPWFAITVRPRHEKSTCAGLQAKGLTPLLPLYTSVSRWSDRIKRVKLPLFPGYLFCRFFMNQQPDVLRTPGVLGIVSCNGNPVPVEQEQIDILTKIAGSGLPVEPCPYLREGKRTRIDNGGPLAGMEGILIQQQGAPRIVIGIELLQLSVVVDINQSVPPQSTGAITSQSLPQLPKPTRVYQRRPWES